MFTAFWLERPALDAGTLTVYALMDSPSMAGAYRFRHLSGRHADHGGGRRALPAQGNRAPGRRPADQHVRMGKTTAAWPTTGARRSMIPMAWPCGPAAASGSGAPGQSGEPALQRLSRPESARLRPAPARPQLRPHYQDDGAFYDRRPSLWVEPKSVGAKAPFNSWRFRRSMKPSTTSWPSGIRRTRRSPVRSCSSATACTGERRCLSILRSHRSADTRSLGGYVGQKRKYFSWRFVVDFAGGDLSMLGKDVEGGAGDYRLTRTDRNSLRRDNWIGCKAIASRLI